jgi:hypothetical protein
MNAEAVAYSFTVLKTTGDVPGSALRLQDRLYDFATDETVMRVDASNRQRVPYGTITVKCHSAGTRMSSSEGSRST